MSEEAKVEEAKVEEKTADEPLKYSDKQVNDLIAKEKGKALTKAESDILSAAGVKSKDELAELVKLRQAQMTESEKSAARIKELEDREKEYATRSEKAEAKAEVLSAGVSADKAERVVKLALSGDYEGENVSDKIKAVLAEFPEFVGSTAAAFGGETKGKTVDATQEMLELARKQAGLKK